MSKNSPFNSPFNSKNVINYEGNNSKDSVCFMLEPERKKGLKVTSKTIKESNEMIILPSNLQSKDLN
jgi:hypothetical protein